MEKLENIKSPEFRRDKDKADIELSPEEEMAKKFLGNTEAIIICRDCKKEVNSVIKPFGYGYIALCPECTGLAYNEKDLPSLEDVKKNN